MGRHHTGENRRQNPEKDKAKADHANRALEDPPEQPGTCPRQDRCCKDSQHPDPDGHELDESLSKYAPVLMGGQDRSGQPDHHKDPDQDHQRPQRPHGRLGQLFGHEGRDDVKQNGDAGHGGQHGCRHSHEDTRRPAPGQLFHKIAPVSSREYGG